MPKPPTKTPRGFARRALRWSAAHPLLATLILVSGVAAAAMTVTYTTASTLATSVAPPAIQFLPGDDTASPTDHVTELTISTNRTYLTTSVMGVPEATLTVGSFFKLQNVDDAARHVTLSSANVTNALVSAYTIEIYDDSDVLVDTLDLRAASTPVTASATIPAGATYSTKLTLTLASTAGADNVDLSNAITLTFA